jgi:hypothetical protein
VRFCTGVVRGESRLLTRDSRDCNDVTGMGLGELVSVKGERPGTILRGDSYGRELKV